jgi:hypothetical protein
MISFGIISVGFDVTVQLVIRFSAFDRYNEIQWHWSAPQWLRVTSCLCYVTLICSTVDESHFLSVLCHTDLLHSGGESLPVLLCHTDVLHSGWESLPVLLCHTDVLHSGWELLSVVLCHTDVLHSGWESLPVVLCHTDVLHSGWVSLPVCVMPHWCAPQWMRVTSCLCYVTLMCSTVAESHFLSCYATLMCSTVDESHFLSVLCHTDVLHSGWESLPVCVTSYWCAPQWMRVTELMSFMFERHPRNFSLWITSWTFKISSRKFASGCSIILYAFILRYFLARKEKTMLLHECCDVGAL